MDASRPSARPAGLLSSAGLSLDDPSLAGAYTFNPTLLREEAGLLCFFRAVMADGRRAIFRVRLDQDFRPAGPAVDWSQEVQARSPGISWLADPRAFRFQGRRHVTFNTGHSETPNRIYMVEVDQEGAPIGPVLEAIRTDGRRPIEKNWGFFEHQGTLYALYGLSPLEILRCHFEGDLLRCEPAFRHAWHSAALEQVHGPLHGGASPLWVEGRLLVAFQSRTQGAGGHTYRGSLLELDPEPPFAPRAVAPDPLFEPLPEEGELVPPRKLNPAADRVLYPAGLVADPASDALILSYGINDFRCGFRRYAPAALFGALRPLTRLEPLRAFRQAPDSPAAGPGVPPLLRTFFWNAPRTPAPTPEDLAQGRFRHGNVGDSMQAHLIGQLFGAAALHLEGEGGRLLGVGSIAHRALPGDVIWGSGFKPVPMPLSLEEKAGIEVRAVRGPLTLEYLAGQGLDVSRVGPFFDPGLLIGEVFPAQIAACRRISRPPSGLLLVPHYKDTPRFQQQWGGAFPIRTVDGDLFTFLVDLLSAELVLSSSLHGVILAEALGIPALLLQPPASETPQKYEDYYLGTGRHRYPVLTDPSEAARARVPELPTLPGGWQATLPRLESAQAHLAEPVFVLRDTPESPSIQAYRRGRLHLDPGRFSGSWFQFVAHLALTRPVQVRLIAGGTCLHETTCHPGGGETLRVGLDGALIESLGGRFCMDFTGTVGQFAFVRNVFGHPA